MNVDYRVISIGTLAAHPLWNESGDVRTGYATTVLIESGDARILVNPSLPAKILEARMSERSPLRCADITQVFLTSFTVEHYRGLAAIDDARWLVHEPERAAATAALAEQADRAAEIGDADLIRRVDEHRQLLERCEVAPDRLAAGVDLFPLPGVTPGTCGLIISLPGTTVLVCGDAVATIEHLREGKVLPTCMDIEQAGESFREAVEIADVLVPGRDNVTVNPLRTL
ncbi:MAG: MBL fold metallo-hydrolase [Planctomycetes bacterium]|nr:MBL fold metallo-hydrolase [Planctomycetota bacterium]